MAESEQKLTINPEPEASVKAEEKEPETIAVAEKAEEK